jgi:hypothetical protein
MVSSGYSTSAYPYICMSYKIPGLTIAGFLIDLPNCGGWRPLTVLEASGCSWGGPVATWAPLILDDAWHYTCINLDAQLRASCGGSSQQVISIIAYELGCNGQSVFGPLHYDDWEITNVIGQPPAPTLQGSYCAPGSGSAAGAPCPPGFSCAGGGSAQPVLCPERTYCPTGSTLPLPCGEGYACPAGTSQQTNARHFIEYVASNHTGDVLAQLPSGSIDSFLAACRSSDACAGVTSRGVMLTALRPLVGNASGLSVYAKANGSSCHAGTWWQVPVDACLSTINVCLPCSVGHWGSAAAAAAGSYNSSSCGGVCTCTAGWYCPAASASMDSANGCVACPVGSYCLGGAAAAGAPHGSSSGSAACVCVCVCVCVCMCVCLDGQRCKFFFLCAFASHTLTFYGPSCVRYVVVH